MSIFHKYRVVVSSLLLAMYTFIIVPAQLWHKHSWQQASDPKQNHFLALKKIDTQSSKPILVQSGAPMLIEYEMLSLDSASDFCSICSHHYSAFANDQQIVSLDFTAPISARRYSSFTPSFPKAEVLQFSNKGPPAIV